MATEDPKVRELFQRIASIEDLSKRMEVLENECGSDPAFRQQVELLLRRNMIAIDRASNANISLDDQANAFFEPSTLPGSMGRLGHYEILEVIGQGGFGTVYRAKDDVLQRIVAIKVMDPILVATASARKRFLREARAAAAVRHDNIVQIYDVEEKPIPYLVMEYIPGETLQQWVRRTGPLSVADVLEIGRQVAEGLAAAHDAGLIHRDVKPSNILIEHNNKEVRARLTDFGLALSNDSNTESQSMISGTPMFMSPEHCTGESIDHRADLFSLGSVLYFLLTAEQPFKARTGMAIMRRVCDEEPTPIREIVPTVPDWLVGVVKRLLQKKPEMRFQTGHELADVLSDKTARVYAIPNTKPPRRFHILPTVVILFLFAIIGFGVSEIFGLTSLTKSPSTIELASATSTNVTTSPTTSAATTPTKTQQTNTKPTTPLTTKPKTRIEPDNDRSMTMIVVPEGRSWIDDGNNMVEVNIDYNFMMSKYEITQSAWTLIMGKNPSACSRQGRNSDAVARYTDEELMFLPVDSVSYDQAQEFVSKMNVLHPRPGYVYRLPTAIEWEYALRGGPAKTPDEVRGDFFFGYERKKLTRAVLTPEIANYEGSNLNCSRPVGSYGIANKLGIYDMHGNVMEYCQELYLDRENQTETDVRVRGGCWHDNMDNCRAKYYGTFPRSVNFLGAGVRLVLVPENRK